MAVLAGAEAGLQDLSLLVAHVLVSPAIAAPRAAPDSRMQGFLVAGHVCTMMGCDEYEPIARRCGVPIVVTAFEPVDLLQGILSCLRQPEAGRAEGENAYGRNPLQRSRSCACLCAVRRAGTDSPAHRRHGACQPLHQLSGEQLPRIC